ncbi:MAG: DNA-3-methyladenine glycosylase family protein [bacterium]
MRTLTSGQVFRWTVEDHAVRGVFAGEPVELQQRAGGIEVIGLGGPDDLTLLSRYLGLEQPLGQVERALSADRVLRRILPLTSGIAMLRQDPWECLISFVISAFNNIPKIEMTLDRLCRRFGEPVGADAWSFPSPDRLARAALRELKSCLLGYRAAYVREIARRVDGGQFDLRRPAAHPYSEARAQLLALPGVGDKVADCVLLFAYEKGEAFPVDVWIKRAVERWYFRGTDRSEQMVRTFAQRRFGQLAGYAQQHLFYYARQRRL